MCILCINNLSRLFAKLIFVRIYLLVDRFITVELQEELTLRWRVLVLGHPGEQVVQDVHKPISHPLINNIFTKRKELWVIDKLLRCQRDKKYFIVLKQAKHILFSSFDWIILITFCMRWCTFQTEWEHFPAHSLLNIQTYPILYLLYSNRDL